MLFELVLVEDVSAVVHLVLVAVDRILVRTVKDYALFVELDAISESLVPALTEVDVLDWKVVVDLEHI